MKPNKWGLVLLMVLFLFVLSACGGGESAPPAEEDAAGDQTEEPVDDGDDEATPAPAVTEVTVDVTPPDGWDIMEGAGLLAGYMHNSGATFLVTRDNVPSEIEDYEGYVEFTKEIYSGTFDNIEFGGVENITVDGYTGKKMSYTYEGMGLTLKAVVIYIIIDDYAYTLTYAALTDFFDGLQGDFDQFVNSVRFE